MEDGIDTIVLDEELAYIDVVPLRWTGSAKPAPLPNMRMFVPNNPALFHNCR